MNKVMLLIANKYGHDILGPFDFVEVGDGKLICGLSDKLGRRRKPMIFKIRQMKIKYRDIVFDRWSTYAAD